MADEYYTIPELAQRFKVNRSTLYKWMRSKDFPKPTNFGGRSSRVKCTDVATWEAAQTA